MASRKSKRKRGEGESSDAAGDGHRSKEAPSREAPPQRPSGYPFSNQEVLAICVTAGGWTLVEINLKTQKLVLHDTKGYKYHDQPQEKEKKKSSFIPMLRVLPQILKSIGYYETHGVNYPKRGQFGLSFGPLMGRLAYREIDAADAALYCTKHLEFIYSSIPMERGIENPRAILAYRRHVAQTIYVHSTDADPIPVSQPVPGSPSVRRDAQRGKSPVPFNLGAQDWL